MRKRLTLRRPRLGVLLLGIGLSFISVMICARLSAEPPDNSSDQSAAAAEADAVEQDRLDILLKRGSVDVYLESNQDADKPFLARALYTRFMKLKAGSFLTFQPTDGTNGSWVFNADDIVAIKVETKK